MEITIKGRKIGPGHPVYIVAEMSANHNQSFERAVTIVQAAKEAGADAVKLQTYTPETMTLDCDNEHFRIRGTPWHGQRLYDLYQQAQTPWEWQPRLKEVAEGLGLDLFSSAFDPSSVEFLERMGVPAYKVSSFELVDIPLLRIIAGTGKPVILSTGMASLEEIGLAVETLRGTGCKELALLKCTSAYPASAEEVNLRTIPHLAETFGVPVGLSDHTLGDAVAVAAVALGACIVEKHFTLSRPDGGPDAAFSMEFDEFRRLVQSVRMAEASLGEVSFALTEKQKQSIVFRRSLFVVKDIPAGGRFTAENVRSIRPGVGLPPRLLDEILGRKATVDIERGTPLALDMVS